MAELVPTSEVGASSPIITDYILPAETVKTGMIYIEAKLQDNIIIDHDQLQDIQNQLHEILSRDNQVFEVGQNILSDKYRASLLLRSLYEKAAAGLQSLNVVEYIGSRDETTCHSSNDVAVKVQVYQLHTRRYEEIEWEYKELSEQGQITNMPHVNFDGQWDELVFENDFKSELLRMMTNILRFSMGPTKRKPTMNPLLLLHGLPGTGKTTLCQGLAQKVSIRLVEKYKETRLIEIRTATLLSKYYSESAKQVDNIFDAINRMCTKNPERFVCVLIDEIESIANSRESSMHGEAQDSMRATNALLTGIDRNRKHPNVVFLCTTNMRSCLDAAFLSRCGHQIAVNPPSSALQYEILRGRIQGLISDGTITSECKVPCYRDAELESTLLQEDLYGARLLHIVDLLRSSAATGRSLTQLPEMSILRHLKGVQCDLDMALGFIEKTIIGPSGLKGESSESAAQSDTSDDTELRARIKRKLVGGHNGVDETFEALEDALVDLVSAMRNVKRRLSSE